MVRAAHVRRDPRARGQSLVEMALGLPTLLILCLGIVDGTRAYSYKEAVTNSDRQVLRVAASQQSVGDAACAGTGATPVAKPLTAHVPWQTGDTLPLYVVNAASQESVDGAGISKITGSSITVTFHCLSGKALTNASATSLDPASLGSDAIETAVCYQFSFLTPLVAKLYGSRNCPGMSGSGVVTLTEDGWARANY
jgi:Flp pilus assembly protein TadG